MAVYINSLNFTTNKWTGWTPVPGSLLTTTGVSVMGRHLYAKGSYGSGIVVGGVYENIFYGGWSGWHLIPGGMTTKSALCACYSLHGDIRVFASRTADGRLCWSDNSGDGPFDPSAVSSFWYTQLYQALTDARTAGPLPEAFIVRNPYYSAFLKGIGDHQVYGLRDTGLQVIPGNKLTDAGIESRSMLLSSQSNTTTRTDKYRHFLFVKDMSDQRLYFNSFETVVTSPVSIY